MDFKELQDFIKSIVRSGASEVNIETADFKLSIKTPEKGKSGQQMEQPIIHQYAMQQQPLNYATSSQPNQQMMNQAVQQNQSPAAQRPEENAQYITVKSPMVGTFYRKPAPNKPDFVNVGDVINSGQVVCIIEAMKLFNEIESEISGKIIKILVEDASPVEFDQPLYLVDPS